jgi:hypothetical protein
MIYRINTKYDKPNIIKAIHILNEDKSWVIKIEPKKQVRSLPSNRLYWLWLACISDETGSDKDELHKHFGLMYLPKVEVRLFDQSKYKPISTTKLDTIQFKNYLDKIQIFASTELGISLPNPNDLIFDQFVEKYKDYI